MKKILVLTKTRLDYYGNPFGLNNSADFITEALNESGYHTTYMPVVDGNSIDAAVSTTGAKIVLIEALWATPEKLEELAKLHKTVSWIVRIHSNIPFLALEGMAIDWIKKMLIIPRVTVVCNNLQTSLELSAVFHEKIPYLPNVYLRPSYCPKKVLGKDCSNSEVIDVSCFGAIRPFKNHLTQGVAAIWAANKQGQILNFHINATRVEQRGDSILRNLVALFDGTRHNLVMHGWQDHATFLNTVSSMDLCMQVSFTESFNIVAADHVHVGVPVLVSPEISWLDSKRGVNPTKCEEIANGVINSLRHDKKEIKSNHTDLSNYNNSSLRTWRLFLNHRA